MEKEKFYKYESKHRCPKCNGYLKYTGSLNQFDNFECLNCHQRFQVEKFYKIENMKSVFNKYGKIEKLN